MKKNIDLHFVVYAIPMIFVSALLVSCSQDNKGTDMPSQPADNLVQSSPGAVLVATATATPEPSNTPLPTSSATPIPPTATTSPTETLPPTETPTITATPTPEWIALNNWSPLGFAILDKCPNRELICWGIESQSVSALTTSFTITIDQDWQKPILSYYHSYNFPHRFVRYYVNREGAEARMIGYVRIKSADRWKLIKTYENESAWYTEMIDLSSYKGTDVFIQFTTETSTGEYWGIRNIPNAISYWYIQDILIIPSFDSAKIQRLTETAPESTP